MPIIKIGMAPTNITPIPTSTKGIKRQFPKIQIVFLIEQSLL